MSTKNERMTFDLFYFTTEMKLSHHDIYKLVVMLTFFDILCQEIKDKESREKFFSVDAL